MYYTYDYYFWVEETKYQGMVNDCLLKYSISTEPTTYPLFDTLKYEFSIPEHEYNIPAINHDLMALYQRGVLTTYGEPHRHLLFEKDDYEKSPFFFVHSTGNSSKAFIESKHKRGKKKIICETCGAFTFDQTAPLTVHSKKMGKRLMVNADTSYWIITNSFAEMLKDWGMKGYQLKEVITGSDEILYQLEPTATLPLRHLSTPLFRREDAERCTNCTVMSHVPYVNYYDQSICELDTDFVTTYEWTTDGKKLYKSLLISKKLRRHLLANRITREVTNDRDKVYGHSDWWLIPIFLI
ncbi:hypothetical protein [Paenisporosarcina indica]|uniref:hypothetical protein n=1 Tax=Paenisporosarcina indica TaxID=650093 RepID=UPI00094FC460|nr:hypothetical protein [Paenisporosarcina indica]